VNNNLPAQPAATQPTSTTTVNAKTIAVTNPPAQVAATPAQVATTPVSASKPADRNDVTLAEHDDVTIPKD
jgi:hypothetical protein